MANQHTKAKTVGNPFQPKQVVTINEAANLNKNVIGAVVEASPNAAPVASAALDGHLGEGNALLLPEGAPERTTVYEGEADARQAGTIVPTRFRPAYRKLAPHELELHDAIKTKAQELADLYAEIGNERTSPVVSQYQDKAIDALELSVMWAIKGLTA